MIDENFGKKIKNRRKELHLTQKQLADVTALTPQTIARYESGEIKNIKLVVVEQLARYLDVNPGWLIGKSEIKERTKDKVYLLEKDKNDLCAILNAVLDYVEDGCSFYWNGKLLDNDMLSSIYNNLIGVQRVTDRMINGKSERYKPLEERLQEIEKNKEKKDDVEITSPVNKFFL